MAPHVSSGSHRFVALAILVEVLIYDERGHSLATATNDGSVVVVIGVGSYFGTHCILFAHEHTFTKRHPTDD